jgi:hypothetical protein
MKKKKAHGMNREPRPIGEILARRFDQKKTSTLYRLTFSKEASRGRGRHLAA